MTPRGMATVEYEYDNVVTYRDLSSIHLQNAKALEAGVFGRKAIMNNWLCLNKAAAEYVIAGMGYTDDVEGVYWCPSRCPSTPMPECFLTEKIWVSEVRPAYPVVFAIAKRLEEHCIASQAAAHVRVQDAFEKLLREKSEEEEEKKRQETVKKEKNRRKKEKKKASSKFDPTLSIKDHKLHPKPQLTTIPDVQHEEKVVAGGDIGSNPILELGRPSKQKVNVGTPSSVNVEAEPQTSIAGGDLGLVLFKLTELGNKVETLSVELKNEVNTLRVELGNKVETLSREVYQMRYELSGVHTDVSLLAERAARTSLVGFVVDRFSSYKVLQPVLSRTLIGKK